MTIELQQSYIYNKRSVFLPNQERFWSFRVFLKKYEAEEHFLDNPSENI